ncbi:cobalt-zinc-cadmium efflux system protein [Pedobacter sp. UYP30]|uniref:cation diffusion facilitator family transporter n=1 Tax=Pedobacter sp. UYP30 TaxID=1756400 RepID=UPI0033945ECA
MTKNHNHQHEGHNHQHHAVIALTNVNNAFIVGIVLNMLYVIIQVFIGFRINSLALLSDAGHNFLDVGALALSLLAFKLNKSKANNRYTYGFKKSSILISLFNAIVLLISIGAIGYEAILRFRHPEPLPGITIAIVSGIGIIVNAVSALMFFRNRDSDLNVKSAFLHLASDAVVSLGLVIGGIIMYYTHIYWIDPILSLVVCAVIIVSTWNLLKDSLRLSLDGVPDTITLKKIKAAALKVKGVVEVHHIHVWAISTTQNALTAHLTVENDTTMLQIQKIKEEVKHHLQHENIHHPTLETETRLTRCTENEC